MRISCGRGWQRMGMVIEISIEHGFLRVRVTGEFSLDSAKEITVEVLNAVVHNKIDKVLVDAREVTGALSALDRYLLGDFVADVVHRFSGPGVPRTTKFATVARPPILDGSRLAETVARNRGIFVKVTEDPEEAREWLGLAKRVL